METMCILLGTIFTTQLHSPQVIFEEVQAFQQGDVPAEDRSWGLGSGEFPRTYIDEQLPALFARRIRFDEIHLEGGALDWIFTGRLGGFTLTLEKGKVSARQVFYDSYAHNEPTDGVVTTKERYSTKSWSHAEAELTAPVHSLDVSIDHRMELSVHVNGLPVLSMHIVFDVSRHQLRYTGQDTVLRGSVLRPATRKAVIKPDVSERHQEIVGFGGITSPMAYRQLSEEGKRLWWEHVCAYNLLVQREYPMGVALNEAMDNWDRPEDAMPHYYGDNFPNGEVTNFEYLKAIRSLGGQVWFEFWALPPWARMDWTDESGEVHKGVADPDIYARAMVNYCRTSVERSGYPPEIVGIQNEVIQPPAIWYAMTAALRRELDAAGFQQVRIHMSDASYLHRGIDWAKAYRASEDTWSLIDYAATHMYDFQDFFRKPDEFDALLLQWRELTRDKPFLSSEVCVNYGPWQLPSYRIAFAMGQLYHKNFVLADASAVIYCWTLLNVVQPSFGWTRTLFEPGSEEGMIPVSSSHQLRVYGAYSRYVRQGMHRVGCVPTDPDLQVSAFAGPDDALTVVMLNRGLGAIEVSLEGVAKVLDSAEIADPYHPNMAWPVVADTVTVPPGAIVTCTNVPLLELPEGFLDQVPL